MKTFIVKTLANAAALAVAVWLLDKITLTGEGTANKVITLTLVALLFGLLNLIVKPLVKLLSLPLLILSLGLFALIINALMLLLTSWLAEGLDLDFRVEGFWTAVFGGLIISVVSWATSMALDRD